MSDGRQSRLVRLERELRDHPLGDPRVVYRLDIDHGERLNALSRPLVDELLEALEEIAADRSAHLVVLGSRSEKAFIGGADVDELARLEDAASATAFIEHLHGLCEALRGLPVPVLAVVNGYCLGAGLEVACSCDLRIASVDALFGMPEVRLGIPSVIEAALLPRFVGVGRARDLVLTGRLIDGSEAQRWGLVEEAVAPQRLAGLVEERVASLLAATPRALRLQKELCRAWEERPLAQAIRDGVDAFGRAFEGDEPGRAIGRFLDERERRRREKKR